MSALKQVLALDRKIICTSYRGYRGNDNFQIEL